MKYEMKTVIAFGFLAISPFIVLKAGAQEFKAARPSSTIIKPNIPSPADIEVTRRNYDRVVSMLSGKGLDRKQIKRWVNASLDAHPGKPDIPNPADIEVTRRNYDRVVSMLVDKGLGHTGIKRWINASIDTHKNRPERPERLQRPERAERPERASVRLVRTERNVRPVRITARPAVRVQRVTRP